MTFRVARDFIGWLEIFIGWLIDYDLVYSLKTYQHIEMSMDRHKVMLEGFICIDKHETVHA